jgi:hypothetical protein
LLANIDFAIKDPLIKSKIRKHIKSNLFWLDFLISLVFT